MCPSALLLMPARLEAARLRFKTRKRSTQQVSLRDIRTGARYADRREGETENKYTSCLFAWRARGPTQDQTTQMQSGNDWKAYISEDDRRERCLILRCKRFTPCKAIPNKSRCIKPELGRYVHLDSLWIALQGVKRRHRKIKQRSRLSSSIISAFHSFPDCICVV